MRRSAACLAATCAAVWRAMRPAQRATNCDVHRAPLGRTSPPIGRPVRNILRGQSRPLRNNCAGWCADMRTPLRGQRACAARAYACGGGEGPPHTAAAGGHASNFVFVRSENFKIRYNKATIVLKDPSFGSDTTVGKPWRIRITYPGEAAEE
ncbi:hypothetical protein F511_12611 [Dorcoceras hygrometricum]|uniref:Uncharacterized protein n=1 Tax=Dorcoceras hygrometricum TaxID=472368 RepID=A0A2Z7C3U9_9LAMI|nr:hypothetical protein F511_12611 [Dorcoceras hygrometricum]